MKDQRHPIPVPPAGSAQHLYSVDAYQRALVHIEVNGVRIGEPIALECGQRLALLVEADAATAQALTYSRNNWITA